MKNYEKLGNNLDNLQFDTLNNLKVVLENASVSVSVDNFPATQDVNITNSYINVGNFPATQNVNLSDITTNTTLNVSDSTTHNYLSTAVSDLNKFNFDSGNNLDINLNITNMLGVTATPLCVNNQTVQPCGGNDIKENKIDDVENFISFVYHLHI